MKEIRSKVFSKGDRKTYIAIYSFLILCIILSIWMFFNLIEDLFHYEILASLIISYITFIIIILDYRSPNIQIYKNKIVLPKMIQKRKILRYDEIKEIKYDLFKKSRNVGKLEIIDTQGKKHSISGFADRTKMLKEIKKRMSRDQWRKKVVKQGYR